jgi:hypothetical protein
MRKLLLAVAVASLAASPPAYAQSDALKAEAARSASIGKDLFLRDQAAWHGTDAVMPLYPDPAGAGLRGWVTERDGDVVTITFIRERDGEFSVLRRGVFKDNKFTLSADPEGAPLTSAQERAHKAVKIAASQKFAACAKTYNQVAIPRENSADGADFDIYLMPASIDWEIPAGGHYRFAVDVDATKIIETQNFTKACLTLPKPPANAAGIMVTELLRQTPTQIHVFLSLTFKTAIFVGIDGDVWEVDGDKVTLVAE